MSPLPRSPLSLVRLIIAGLFSFWVMQAGASTQASGMPSVGPHPRLLLTNGDLDRIRAQATSDAGLAALLAQALATSEARLEAAPPERTFTGKRLLFVSRRVLADAVWLGFAYRLTGEERYRTVLERNLLAAAGFSDWNPSHFLDVAEMSAALAIGYDWLQPGLSEETEAVIRTAILEKGLRPALDGEAPHNWWHRREMNWNQVCLGGLTLAALAVAEKAPAEAASAIDLVGRMHRFGLKPYEPDGIYPEGAHYWRYGTSYSVLALAALQSATGSEAPFGDLDAFLSGARVQGRLMGVNGESFGFGDSSVGAFPDPLLFWFADRMRDPELLAGQDRYYLPLAKPRKESSWEWEQILAIRHWRSPGPSRREGMQVWSGRGNVPLVVFNHPGARGGGFHLAAKGGAARASHGHMDAGSFVLDMAGLRWAEDIGGQNYTDLESRGIKLFDSRQEGDRWRIFRYTNFAHSTLTLDRNLHRAEGSAPIVTVENNPEAPYAAIDLAPVLQPTPRKALRVFRARADGRHVSVSDSLEGLPPSSTVTWTLVTRAQVRIEGRQATLSRGDRTLLLAAAPGTAPSQFEVREASGPESFDARAAEHRLVTYTVTVPKDGTVALTFTLEVL